MSQVGVLLVNLGTPKSLSQQAVSEYLRTFLMDPYVIDIPWIFRWPLVNLLIVPRRTHQTLANYKKIWTTEGSPLLIYTRALTQKLQDKMVEKIEERKGSHVSVEFGMTYGEPSLDTGIKNLIDRGCHQIIVFPLYPQFANATTGTAFKGLRRLFRKGVQMSFVPHYFSNPRYIQSMISRIRKEKPYKNIVCSFHGLPIRQLRKMHPVCLSSSTCCDEINEGNSRCYKAHCFHTVRALEKELGNEYNLHIAFQSRLGPEKWTGPSINDVVERLAQSQITEISVVSPSFITDCLETLEEINIRTREYYFSKGGKSFQYIPCLNDSETWVENLTHMILKE